NEKHVTDYERALAIPYRLLTDVEAEAPQVIASMLAMPQFGAWADDCIRRLLAPPDSDWPGGVPLATDLGHLALFAATAAMRAGRHFEIWVPLRDGAACFPSLGTAHPGARGRWGWAVASGDDAGCRVQSSGASVAITDRAISGSAITDHAAWRP